VDRPAEQSDPPACPSERDAGKDASPTDPARRLLEFSLPVIPPPDQEPEEVELWVKQAQDGDRDAFERLIVHFQDRVWRRAMYRLRDADEAEDLAQEVLLLCYRKIHQFRGESKFWTWLCRIVDNQVKNRIGWMQRRGKGKTFSLDAPLQGDDGADSNLHWEPPDPAADPRREAEGHEAVDRLNASLESLTADHREILLLRFSDELSYEEIAARLEITLATVKSRINRARAELRTLMRDILED
jgi:RNA polymerase sigma-70 factor, ECF subfamily